MSTKAETPTEAAPDKKQKLAEGAAAIRKAMAAQKKADAAAAKKAKADEKAASKDKGKDKQQPPVIVEPPVKAVHPSKGAIEDILQAHCTVIDHCAVELDKDTTAGDYLRIFDHFSGMSERVGFFLGDIINAGQNILGEKYEAVMAASGRSLQTLKNYASVAKNVPPSLRKLHPSLGYTHLAQVAKVPALEDKKRILDEAATAAEAGSPMTVKEIAEKAHKLVPKKSKGPKPGAKNKTPKGKGKGKTGTGKREEPIEMNAEQRSIYEEIEMAAAQLETLVAGAGAEKLRSFVFLIGYKEKKALLDLFLPLASFSNNLFKYLGYPA